MREIRQSFSTYLRRVEVGESFEVTDRGRPVAVLISNREALEAAAVEIVLGLVESGAYPSVEAAVAEGVAALARRVRSELVGQAIVDGYTRIPQEPDPWVDEAARLAFEDLEPW